MTEWIDLRTTGLYGRFMGAYLILQVSSLFTGLFGCCLCFCLLPPATPFLCPYASLTYSIFLTIVHTDGTSILSSTMASYPESLLLFRGEQEKRRVSLRSGTVLRSTLMESYYVLMRHSRVLLRPFGTSKTSGFRLSSSRTPVALTSGIELRDYRNSSWFPFQRINSSNLTRQSKLWSRCIEIKASWS
jgi:hypothetical protein